MNVFLKHKECPSKIEVKQFNLIRVFYYDANITQNATDTNKIRLWSDEKFDLSILIKLPL